MPITLRFKYEHVRNRYRNVRNVYRLCCYLGRLNSKIKKNSYWADPILF